MYYIDARITLYQSIVSIVRYNITVPPRIFYALQVTYFQKVVTEMLVVHKKIMWYSIIIDRLTYNTCIRVAK